MSNLGIKISKEKKDVKVCKDKELILSSKFNTLKIGFSGRLTLNVPDWTHTYAGTPISKVDVAYVTHNLGYIPYYAPRCVGEDMEGGMTWEPFNIYINDIVRGYPLTNYSPPSWIVGRVEMYATKNRLYLQGTRSVNYSPEWPYTSTWKGGVVYVDYTIFRNSLSEEFNLLSS